MRVPFVTDSVMIPLLMSFMKYKFKTADIRISNFVSSVDFRSKYNTMMIKTNQVSPFSNELAREFTPNRNLDNKSEFPKKNI